jgi:hypothetical protein
VLESIKTIAGARSEVGFGREASYDCINEYLESTCVATNWWPLTNQSKER